MGGVEEVRDGRRRNEWTGEGEEEKLQNELTGSAKLGQRKRKDVIQLTEGELVETAKTDDEHDGGPSTIDADRDDGGDKLTSKQKHAVKLVQNEMSEAMRLKSSAMTVSTRTSGEEPVIQHERTDADRWMQRKVSGEGVVDEVWRTREVFQLRDHGPLREGLLIEREWPRK